MNWNVALGDGSIRDVIYWPELANLDDFHKVRGGNPILFPFNGRSFVDGEIGFWKDAMGVRRPMPMHGLARQGDFKLIKADAVSFEALFIPGAEAKEAYPFDYEFTVDYRFAPLGLTCEFTLENRGPDPLPWSSGHHFYFTLPWSEGSQRSDYLIRIPAGRRIKQDTRGALQPGPDLPMDVPMDDPRLIDTIHTNLRSSLVVFGEKSRPGDVSIRIGTAPVPPPEATFVTWTLAPESPFYCVEPWMGPPNSPENKFGLHWVQPGTKQTFTVEVSIK